MQMLLNGAIPGSQEPARIGEDRHPTSIIGRLYRLGEAGLRRIAPSILLAMIEPGHLVY
jgi:hypothetical protein